MYLLRNCPAVACKCCGCPSPVYLRTLGRVYPSLHYPAPPTHWCWWLCPHTAAVLPISRRWGLGVEGWPLICSVPRPSSVTRSQEPSPDLGHWHDSCYSCSVCCLSSGSWAQMWRLWVRYTSTSSSSSHLVTAQQVHWAAVITHTSPSPLQSQCSVVMWLKIKIVFLLKTVIVIKYSDRSSVFLVPKVCL